MTAAEALELRPGDPVWYQPILGPGEKRFAGVVRTEPWVLGDGRTVVVHLRDMEPAYAATRGKTGVHAASHEALSRREETL